VSFAAINLCVASQRVFNFIVVVYFVMTQSGNFWIHSRTNVGQPFKTCFIFSLFQYKLQLLKCLCLYEFNFCCCYVIRKSQITE
jgi:hypothetical protein